MEKSFRHMTLEERLTFLGHECDLSAEERDLLRGTRLSSDIAENLIENAVGYFQVPLGIATNFTIDGRDRLIPMAVEETSIIAAASATAKWIRATGSIKTQCRGNLIIGQVQLPRVQDAERVKALLMAEIPRLINAANALLPGLVARGYGVRQILIRELARPESATDKMLVLHLQCDSGDAMGANLINQVCEGLKPLIEAITGELVGLCILSNLNDGKLATAEVTIRDIDPKLGDGIEEATLFAQLDPYRAATHNKGVLNGIDPILIATGNDWRAVEAGVHAYACRSGNYQPVTTWKRVGRDLIGKIEIPMAIGTVGGVTRLHPSARVALKILGIEHADELARICVAVGLVQNLAALRALSTVGIVRGHMELHAANLALAAGSRPDEVLQVRIRLSRMLQEKKAIGVQVAQEILREIRNQAAELPA